MYLKVPFPSLLLHHFSAIDLYVGHYLYIETSAPRRLNDKARLMSPVFPPTASSCLRFYYHMNGATIGSLKVYSTQTSTPTLVFSQSGNQVTIFLCFLVTFFFNIFKLYKTLLINRPPKDIVNIENE